MGEPVDWRDYKGSLFPIYLTDHADTTADYGELFVSARPDALSLSDHLLFPCTPLLSTGQQQLH